MIWEGSKTDSEEPLEPSTKWEVVPNVSEQNQPPSMVIWEVLKSEDEALITPSQAATDSIVQPPSNLEEAEALLRVIPIQPSDYQPLLRLSHLVYTAETLATDHWRFTVGTISPVGSNIGTKNQNRYVNLDIGINNNLLFSLFGSQADEPLNAKLNGFSRQSSNFWQSYGAAALWQVMNQNNWKVAIGGSLESWEVGSGNDSFDGPRNN